MASNETNQLMNMIASKCNEFFGSVSYVKYQFENPTLTKISKQSRKQKLLVKAFRQYKSKKLSELPSGKQIINLDLSDKQKKDLMSRNWDKLSNQQKLKYSPGSKLLQKKSKKKKDDQIQI